MPPHLELSAATCRADFTMMPPAPMILPRISLIPSSATPRVWVVIQWVVRIHGSNFFT